VGGPFDLFGVFELDPGFGGPGPDLALERGRVRHGSPRGGVVCEREQGESALLGLVGRSEIVVVGGGHARARPLTNFLKPFSVN
jgi:hypothetical protein